MLVTLISTLTTVHATVLFNFNYSFNYFKFIQQTRYGTRNIHDGTFKVSSAWAQQHSLCKHARLRGGPPAVKQTALSLSQQWKAPRVVKEANALGHPFGSHQGALELAHFCHVLCLRRRKILDIISDKLDNSHTIDKWSSKAAFAPLSS